MASPKITIRNSMYLNLIIILGAAYYAADANHGALTDCFSCAGARDGANFMCQWGGDSWKNPYETVCCENSESTYCKPSGKNVCSKTKKESGYKFYNYCPNIKNETCGGGQYFTPTTEKKEFTISSLQRISGGAQPWKIALYA